MIFKDKNFQNAINSKIIKVNTSDSFAYEGITKYQAHAVTVNATPTSKSIGTSGYYRYLKKTVTPIASF